MDEFVICMTVLFFLGWVIYLKSKISQLQETNEKMSKLLKRYVKDVKSELGESAEKPIFGQKPHWMK